MEERELVRINLQLPASALDSLSRLAEQLRLLTAAAGDSGLGRSTRKMPPLMRSASGACSRRASGSSLRRRGRML